MERQDSGGLLSGHGLDGIQRRELPPRGKRGAADDQNNSAKETLTSGINIVLKETAKHCFSIVRFLFLKSPKEDDASLYD